MGMRAMANVSERDVLKQGESAMSGSRQGSAGMLGVRPWVVLVAVAVLPLAVVRPAAAQTQLESSDGESSVVLKQGGVLLLNFSDASIKFGLTRVVSTKPLRLGAEAKAAASG